MWENAVYAIKKNVFDEKRMTAAELKEALDNNFAGEKGEVIRKYLLERTEKYGNDEEEVDELTNELANYYVDQIYHYKTLREGKGPIGCCYTSSTVTITANIPSGAIVGASADGRKEGMPTADGISPSTGTMKKGLTGNVPICRNIEYRAFHRRTAVECKDQSEYTENRRGRG